MSDVTQVASKTAKQKPVQLEPPLSITIDGVRYPATAYPQNVDGNATGAGHYLYIFTHGNGSTAKTKIGITRDVDARLASINSSSPVRVRLAHAWKVPDYTVAWAERAAHQILQHKHSHNEWFNCDQHLAGRAVSFVLPFVTNLKYLWRLRRTDPDYWVAIIEEFKKHQASLFAEYPEEFVRPCNRHHLKTAPPPPPLCGGRAV